MYASYIGIGDFFFGWNFKLSSSFGLLNSGLAKYMSSMDLYFWILIGSHVVSPQLIGKEVESLD